MSHFVRLRSRRLAGFTLLELLVVVAIIGFLSSVSIVALSASKAKSRDTQRKLDAVTIIKAAELYTNDFGAPPTQLCQDDNTTDATPCTSNAGFTAPSDGKDAEDKGVFLWHDIFSAPHALAQIFPVLEFCPDCGTEQPTGGGGPPPSGPGGPYCGDHICNNSETAGSCPGDCAICNNNNICESGEANAYCANDCRCLINGICEAERGETIFNCGTDCFQIDEGGGGSTVCGNNSCEPGETPGSCSHDCTNSSMCYGNNSWDLCCLYGTTYCTGTSAGSSSETAGYYGVCDNDRCEQKFLLQAPSFTCTADTECVPNQGGGDETAPLKFVDNTDTNWLVGLQPYLVALPEDPGASRTAVYNSYYASSHPDIVNQHGFCVFFSLERLSDNINPYNDITQTPTGPLDQLHWSTLCVR